MTLYDFLEKEKSDFDTWDTVYDQCVTVCYTCDEHEENSYFKFCNGISKKVEITEKINDFTVQVEWSRLIKENMEKFKFFSDTNWKNKYDDEDVFIEQWIEEIHHYIAGYVDEDFYETLNKFISTLA